MSACRASGVSCPLLVLGLLRRAVWRCCDCHAVLEQARRLTLGC
jgi:hypothetical protein